MQALCALISRDLPALTRLLVLIVGTCALALLIGLIDPPGERAVAIRLNADLHGSAVSGVDEAATLEFYQQRHHRLAWWQDGTWRPETGIALNLADQRDQPVAWRNLAQRPEPEWFVLRR